MALSFDDKKEEILRALSLKCGPFVKCPSCSGNNFTLIEGFINQPIAKELSGSIMIGGPTIPLIAVACKNCGNMQYHALKALLPDLKFE